MRWPWSKEVEERSTYSIADPALAQFFGYGAVPNLANVSVNEYSALGLSAVWRAVMLISGTLASLPLKSHRESQGQVEDIQTFLDSPGGMTPDAPTAFEWKEMVIAHALIHGNAYLAHVFNGAGALTALVPFHPLCVCPEWETDELGRRTMRKIFKVSQYGGPDVELDSSEMTQIMGFSLDGLKGLSPISIARNSLGTAIAGDRAAARMFGNGAMVSGMVTPEDDIDEAEATTIKEGLKAKISGVDNAGDIAVINRRLKFTQWSTSNLDAQFLESRQFSIEEIARWFGVPPHALMQTEKQTSWGTGVDEQNRGLSRTVLSPWAQRFDQRLSRLLPRGQWVEFEFAGLERGNPAEEIRLLIEQVNAGLLTLNEARGIRNLPPIDGGDAPKAIEGGAIE